MAGPAGRSPDEEALLLKAMRVLPGGVLGGYYAPQELAFVVREAHGPRLHDFSGPRVHRLRPRQRARWCWATPIPRWSPRCEAQLRKGTTYFSSASPPSRWPRRSAARCRARSRCASARTRQRGDLLRAAGGARLPRRDKILKFEGGFHGAHDYSLMSVGPRSPKAFPAPMPDSAGIPHAIQGEVLIAPVQRPGRGRGA